VKAAIAAGAILVAAVAVLAVTGFMLADRYRPTGAVEFDSPSELRTVETLHDWHQGAAVVAIAAGVVFTVIAFRRRRRLLIGAAIAATAVLVGGYVSGPWLGWDQLALWAVTVGSEFEGYGVWEAAFDDDVRFVLQGGSEVDQDDYAAAVIIHNIALPALLLAALVTAAIAMRRRSSDVA
jgi:quinol-cytochrome oxidoreductase complex cytochrome b subunit